MHAFNPAKNESEKIQESEIPIENKIKQKAEEMKTNLLIPFEPAPEDPVWLVKAQAGKRLDPIEAEEYFLYKFELEFKKLRSDKY